MTGGLRLCAAAFLAATTMLCAAGGPAWGQGPAAASGTAASAADRPALGPIQTVTLGKNGEFVVNGKPFLPIMSWAQNARTYPKLAALGFNTFCGSADADAAKAAGGYAVADFNTKWVGNPYLLAWIHGDEPDMPGKKDPNNPQAGKPPRHTPDQLVPQYKKIKEANTGRPVFVTFTGSFTDMEKDYDDATKAKLYPEYAKSADVVGFDIYPIYGSGHPSHLDWVAKGVTQLRALSGGRPVYAWIETSKGSQWMTYEKQPDVLPMHTRAEVWMALIRGATGVGYFTHVWKPAFKEFGPNEEMQAELKRLNAQITRLAPAILAAPAAGKIEMKLAADGADLGCHCKATQGDGSVWIFAQNIDLGEGAEKLKQFDPIKPRSGKAAFAVEGLKAGTKIEVVDENRTITAEAGKFADDFAVLAEHVYKIKM
jgi:hypothetical protein